MISKVIQFLKDQVTGKIDSWRVSEMFCGCGKHWVATYPTQAIKLQCPNCGNYVRAPFGLINKGDE